MLTQHSLISKPATCHPDRKAWACGLCKSCYDKALKKRNPEYAKRQRETSAIWQKQHAESRRQYGKAWRAKQDPRYEFWKNLRKYGMTVEQYEKMLANQGGVCAICKKPTKSGKRLAIDHCHDTGHIRGLLCFRCNFGLTWFGENSLTLLRASEYLKKGYGYGHDASSN